MPIHQSQSIQIHKLTDSQIDTNWHIYRFTNWQNYKFTNYKVTNLQIHKFTNTQIVSQYIIDYFTSSHVQTTW